MTLLIDNFFTALQRFTTCYLQCDIAYDTDETSKIELI